MIEAFEDGKLRKQCQCGVRLAWNWPVWCEKCKTFCHTAYVRPINMLYEDFIVRDTHDHTPIDLIGPLDWRLRTSI